MKSVLGSPFGTRGALSRTLCSRLAKCSRKRLRISFPVIRGEFSVWGEALQPQFGQAANVSGLRSQPLQAPAPAPPADVADAVVQPVVAALPELDPARR